MTRYPYGQELILDIHNCDKLLSPRTLISTYFIVLCDAIDMELCDVHFWDDEDAIPGEEQTHEDTKGTSAICFIITSNITIHYLELRREVYLNIFSCKEFDSEVAKKVSLQYFGGNIINETIIERGRDVKSRTG